MRWDIRRLLLRIRGLRKKTVFVIVSLAVLCAVYVSQLVADPIVKVGLSSSASYDGNLIDFMSLTGFSLNKYRI